MNYDEREGRAGQGRRGAVPDVTLDWQLRAPLLATGCWLLLCREA